MTDCPDQLPLWWYCSICGAPHFDLSTRLRCVPPEHRHCHEAFDRWFRSDNEADWIDEPERAAL
ncbi:hypothetical protein [Mycobacterium sp. IS-1556]|uniref:hypothetical protein n=1 Tax=Mycobacterium sp. IS-1556 TaxID=1772276 RepID=UPI0007416AA2|nr:hypothetical protein [Mycobacterium sp. IS-1556]KUH89806.1 hypothetical protein AU187_16045 [Mycobacterium sp. IS-1556]